jgi:hypothetical protein
MLCQLLVRWPMPKQRPTVASLPPVAAAAQMSGEVFHVRASNTCARWQCTTTEYIEWLANEHGFHLTFPVWAAWRRTELAIRNKATQMSDVRIYVYKLEAVPAAMGSKCIDVANTYHTDAHSAQYALKHVTGVDLRVQARLVTQVATAQAIEDAVGQIELQQNVTTREIAFACDGGTHRSFGCACLLASLAYPGAGVIPSTPRTVGDARAHLEARPALQ